MEIILALLFAAAAVYFFFIRKTTTVDTPQVAPDKVELPPVVETMISPQVTPQAAPLAPEVTVSHDIGGSYEVPVTAKPAPPKKVRKPRAPKVVPPVVVEPVKKAAPKKDAANVAPKTKTRSKKA